MKHYALFTLLGAVIDKPEMMAWERDGREPMQYVNFTVDVASMKKTDTRTEEVHQTFQVSVWNEAHFAAAMSLQPGQGVQVAGELESQRKDGQRGTYYNLRMRAKFLVPGVMPTSTASGSGAAGPAQYPQGGYQAHAPAPQAQAQAQAPAPLPHEDEDDLPF